MQLLPPLDEEGEVVPVAVAVVVGVVPVATVLMPPARVAVVAVFETTPSVVAVVGEPPGVLGVERAVALDFDAKNAEREAGGGPTWILS